MIAFFRHLFAAAGLAVVTQASGQVTFYGHSGIGDDHAVLNLQT